MIRAPRAVGVWLLCAALLAVVSLAALAARVRAERLLMVSEWRTTAETGGMRLRVGATDGLLWPSSLRNVELDVSPNVSVGIARLTLGSMPWQNVGRAHGVVVKVRGPLDAFWDEVHGLALPAKVALADTRIEYTDVSLGKVTAEGVSFQPSAQRDHLHAQTLHAFGTTFHDVHLWASRPKTAIEIRLARSAEDPNALRFGFVNSPGEGVEWTLGIPSQPFSEWAARIGLKSDESWNEAVVVGTGSLISPESRALPARAEFRFTIDNWHRPSWPEAGLLTGRSGAIALRVSPGPGATHTISRVEVAAGLFSLVGNGRLSFGEPNRLFFDARGELSCARLLAHLPASGYRDRVRAHLSEHSPGSASEASVLLELSVRAEAPRGLPLKFRWHLHEGCGLSELKED